MDFTEHMAEYLSGTAWGEDESTIRKLDDRHPGFKDRIKAFDANIDGYRSMGDDDLLVELLKESFVISGIFEDARIEKMRASLKRAEQTRKDWMAVDLTLGN